MYRLKEDFTGELEIKKSKFICYLHKSYTEDDAKNFIQQIRKQHPNANHHCYAFIIGEQNEMQRSNDDGEPQGTAGVPMLECLANNQMQDILAVCVRYFGGIKLGAGGLIRAYSKSVSNALNGAVRTKKQRMLHYTIMFPYELIGKMDYFFRKNQISVLEKQYHELVYYEYICCKSIDEEIAELTNGKFLPTFLTEVIIDLDLS